MAGQGRDTVYHVGGNLQTDAVSHDEGVDMFDIAVRIGSCVT